MASKKLVLGILLAGAVGYYFYDKNKKEGGSSTAPATQEPKRLNEAEARQYGINNPDVAEYFKNDWQLMADHWWGTGFYEGRSYLPPGK